MDQRDQSSSRRPVSLSNACRRSRRKRIATRSSDATSESAETTTRREASRRSLSATCTIVVLPSGSMVSTLPLASASGSSADVSTMSCGRTPNVTFRPAARRADSRSSCGDTSGAIRFIAGDPTNCATNVIDRTSVHGAGAVHLFEGPVSHHADSRAERHRLFLIMRHVDHRRVQPSMQHRELGACVQT